MLKKEDDDIREVMRSERARGARRVTVSAQSEKNLKERLHKILAINDEREFVAAVREEFGITESSPKFSSIFRLWREQH